VQLLSVEPLLSSPAPDSPAHVQHAVGSGSAAEAAEGTQAVAVQDCTCHAVSKAVLTVATQRVATVATRVSTYWAQGV
jgi:hypothetical protein